MSWESDYPVCGLLVTYCVFWWVEVFNFVEVQFKALCILSNVNPHSRCSCSFPLWTFKFSFYHKICNLPLVNFCIVILCIMWGVSHNSIYPIRIFSWSRASCWKGFSVPIELYWCLVKNHLYMCKSVFWVPSHHPLFICSQSRYCICTSLLLTQPATCSCGLLTSCGIIHSITYNP